MYDTNCEDSNVTVLYRTNGVRPAGDGDPEGEAFQFLYLSKKGTAGTTASRRGYGDDFDKSVSRSIGKHIARKSHEAFPPGEEISQVLVNHCMTFHLNGNRNPDAVLTTAAEFLNHLNLTKVNAFVASVDIKDELLTGNSNIWEVSLEEGNVHPTYLFSGYVANLENITISHY